MPFQQKANAWLGPEEGAGWVIHACPREAGALGVGRCPNPLRPTLIREGVEWAISWPGLLLLHTLSRSYWCKLESFFGNSPGRPPTCGDLRWLPFHPFPWCVCPRLAPGCMGALGAPLRASAGGGGVFPSGSGIVSTLIFLSTSTGDTDHSWQPQCSVTCPPRLGTKQRGCEGGLRGQTAGPFMCMNHMSLHGSQLSLSSKLIIGLLSTSWENPHTPTLTFWKHKTSVCTAGGVAFRFVGPSQTASISPLFGGAFSVSFPLCFSYVLPCSRDSLGGLVVKGGGEGTIASISSFWCLWSQPFLGSVSQPQLLALSLTSDYWPIFMATEDKGDYNPKSMKHLRIIQRVEERHKRELFSWEFMLPTKNPVCLWLGNTLGRKWLDVANNFLAIREYLTSFTPNSSSEKWVDLGRIFPRSLPVQTFSNQTLSSWFQACGGA